MKIWVIAVLALFAGPILAEEPRILVQSTTSTQNSGLYDHLLPLFEAETGREVHVVAVGTGQAIRNARNGDADVLIVHSKADEEAFVADGHGRARHDLMFNDFVLIGPAEDPAGIGAAAGLAEALQRLAKGSAVIVSRGDDSGTHKKEQALWQMIGADPASFGPRYRETGSGMGATLRVATEMQAYTLTDRATWIAFAAKSGHRILAEGDPALHNQYGIIVLDPARHPHVNIEGADALAAWLLGPEGQAAIAAFAKDGRQLFFPNAPQ